MPDPVAGSTPVMARYWRRWREACLVTVRGFSADKIRLDARVRCQAASLIRIQASVSTPSF